MPDNEKPAILIAEDEEINRTILREILKSKYRILEAENGKQAVLYIQSQKETISLLILDIHMPKMDGFEVLDYLRESGLNSSIPVIITTADRSADVLLQGKKNRVADIVYKPFNAGEIRKQVDYIVSVRNVEHNLDGIVSSTSEYLSNQYEVIRKAHLFNLGRWEENMTSLIKETIPDSMEHVGRIKAYTQLMCDGLMKVYPEYGITRSTAKTIADATILHDIGKLAIPDEVFDRKASIAERGLMQLHRRPKAAGELVNLLLDGPLYKNERRICRDICRFMHERYDGKGYPEGLMGQEIPISAQIVGIVHRYDELRYPEGKTGVSHTIAMQTILGSEEAAYNPDLLNIFEAGSEQFKMISNEK